MKNVSVKEALEYVHKKRKEMQELQTRHDELMGRFAAADENELVNKYMSEVDSIDARIKELANRKIALINELSQYHNVLKMYDIKHPSMKLTTKPIPGRPHRYEDVVTGAIYQDPIIACLEENIHVKMGEDAGQCWKRARGYDLRKVK